MKDTQIWILTTVVTVLGGITIGVVRWSFARIIKSMDEIVSDMRQITLTIANHDQRIQSLHDADNAATTRMNDHSSRIRAAEQDIAILKAKSKI